MRPGNIRVRWQRGGDLIVVLKGHLLRLVELLLGTALDL